MTSQNTYDVVLLRTAFDTALSLPIVLMKNRIQAGQTLSPRGCLVFSSTYTLSTLVGYGCLQWESAVAGMLFSGAASTTMELWSRPLLTMNSPTVMTCKLMLARELFFYGGLRLTDSLVSSNNFMQAMATQCVFICGFCNVLDVYLAKSITLQWKKNTDVVEWTSTNKRNLGVLMTKSTVPRLLSGILIPVFVMSTFK